MGWQTGLGIHPTPDGGLVIEIIYEGGLQAYRCQLTLEQAKMVQADLNTKIATIEKEGVIRRQIILPPNGLAEHLGR